MKRFMKRLVYRNGDPNVPPPPPPPPPAKLFTQEEVNTMMANNRKNLQEEHKKTVQMLEEAKTAAGLSKTQVDELQARIDNLNSQNMTEQERLKAAADKATKDRETAVSAAEARAAAADKRFNDLMISHSIHKAAVENNAASDTQMLAMYGHQAKVVQVIDGEGKPIEGKYVVKIPVEVPDGKKGTKVLDLEATEAFAKLREMQPFQNLFNKGGKSGLGGTTIPKTSTGATDYANMDTETFMEQRQKNKAN